MSNFPIALLLACVGLSAETGRQAPAADSFQVQFQGTTPDPQLAAECERLLSVLRKDWFALEEIAWRPRCRVVVHAERSSYVAAVGAAGRFTVGSSRVRLARGRVIERRIDLLALTTAEALKNLRHELVHVLFAERFPHRAPPRWAEEGLALLTDTAEKQVRHRRDLRYAVRTAATIPLPELLKATEYPDGWQRAVFYGQSLALVEFLVARESPRSFIQFVDLASKSGYDQALRDVYQLKDTAALRHLWRTDLQTLLVDAE